MMLTDYAKEILQIPLLSDDETTALLIKKTNGSMDARNKLIKHNMRLTLKFAFHYNKITSYLVDDLIGIASVALIQAIDDFDLYKNIKLSTVIYTYIDNYLKKYFRYELREKRNYLNDMSLQLVTRVFDSGETLNIEDTLVDENFSVENIVLEKNRNEKLRMALEKLTEDEREVLCLRYGLFDGINHTLKEIAEVQGFSIERIRQKEKKAFKKLNTPSVARQLKNFL